MQVWTQVYNPLGSLWLSALVAALPIRLLKEFVVIIVADALLTISSAVLAPWKLPATIVLMRTTLAVSEAPMPMPPPAVTAWFLVKVLLVMVIGVLPAESLVYSPPPLDAAVFP